MRPAALAALIMALLAAAAIYWWQAHRGAALPQSIVEANGRLEMARIDIAAKYAGRVVDLPIQEGDLVQAGQILARQDVAEIDAEAAGARAQRAQAVEGLERARAALQAQRSARQLAHLEWSQTEGLKAKKLVSDVELQRRRIALDSAEAEVAAASAALKEAQSAVDAADAQLARIDVVRDEMTIRSPIRGRIEYRLIERDAVVPAGGRIATLLDPSDVYMTVFLPDRVAGQLRIGDEARIVLDAFEGHALAATVSFVAPEAQFTPKYVETRSEREKLAYRVKLQVPKDLAREYEGQLKAGETGDGYVRVDTRAAWPAWLTLTGRVR